jgi:cytochrome P450
MAGAPTSVFSTASHDHHRIRRAALNPFFAKRSVVRLEPRLTSKVELLCTRLAEEMKQERVVQLKAAYMALTMDIMSEYCFGKSCDYLQEPDFKREWNELIELLTETVGTRRAFPWMTPLLQAMPVGPLLKLMPSWEFLVNWQKDLKRQAEAIISDADKKRPESIFSTLLENPDVPPEEKTLRRLTDEGEVLLAAGSETSARTLAYTTCYILLHPEVVQKLQHELKKAIPNAKDSPTWTELEQVPYLASGMIPSQDRY